MAVTIVIDPGHGGSNEGGKTDVYMEKLLTLKVAKALKEHLEKFDGVTVYLTRDTDVDMAISDRLDYAAAVNADFFVSIHFNMSVEHDLYGFEVWLPSHKALYDKAYPFAEIIHQDYTLGTYDLFSRGIKTRLGNQGDYYGVIRYGTAHNIPSVIVEHAHMDNANDNRIIPASDIDNACRNLGIRDAEALAKAFHLSSAVLGEDYSGYALPKSNANKAIIVPDETPPDKCSISLLGTDTKSSTVSIMIDAYDKDSYLLYYKISTDGGVTYSALMPWKRSAWNKSDNAMEAEIEVKPGTELDVVVTVYNSFDKTAESNHLYVPALIQNIETAGAEPENSQDMVIAAQTSVDIELAASEAPDVHYDEISYFESADSADEELIQGTLKTEHSSPGNGFYIGAFAFVAVLLLVLIIAMYNFIFKRRRENGRKKPASDMKRRQLNTDEFDIEETGDYEL